ncbi:MAG TPA: peptide-N-glycosidase F-related protein [Flavobacteriaceae bacterium]|nr:peptide-N-glycosidase F-related protein [Flavobacteriaceae bacterium]
MKKITCAVFFLASLALQALVTTPGDTTWVHTNQVNLDYYGDFDATVTFPDGSKTYRKILMICTLGQYDCPGNPQYCHQWDYTVNLQLITPTETFEMGRFITPYATSGWPRFGPSWKQPYVFDVTDFYPLLQGNKDVRIHYSGYSGGFTAKLSFALIEGTPARNVVGIKKLFDVSHTYGDAADPFNNYLPSINETAPAGTQSAAMKFLVTGHGSDNNGCCEFDSHFYKVLLNSAQIAQKDIWRDDCGLNDLYPQGGTWIYDRANWCPGAKVYPNYHELPNITGGSSYQLDVQFENYTGGGSLGSYHCSATVFYYGAYNKTLDASLTDIIAPTTDPNHFRANPSGSIPKIKVHNAGGTAITSIDFSYGVTDSTSVNYTWTGTLAPLEDTTISFPELQTLTNMSIAGLNGTYEFEVAITGVNGQTDDDATNNNMVSDFALAPLWPSDLMLTLKTSNIVETNGSWFLGNPNQKWVITDMSGAVVASRDNTNADTQYSDQVSLPAAGFYKLKLTSDNCAGLHWWPFDGTPAVHPGFFKVKDMSGTSIPMNNYAYAGTPRDDWGCEYVQYFTVASAGTAGIEDQTYTESIRVYPNPATNFFMIDVVGLAPPYNIRLVDILGKTVFQTKAQRQSIQIPTREFSAGLYMLIFQDSNGQKRVKKIVITK